MAWLIGYLAFVVAGQRFSTLAVESGFQFPVYENLVGEPVVTVAQTHVQPPMWNLTVGLVARWSPFPDAISWQILMAAVGLVGVLAAGWTCRRCDVGRWPAFVIAVGVGFFPTLFTNVFDLAYELPVSVLLMLLAALIAGPQPMSRRRFVAVVAVLLIIVLTRALYHWSWMLALLVVAARSARHLDRRMVTAVVLVPVLAVGAVAMKNYALVGSASVTSWGGMNQLRSVQFAVPQSELDEMVDRGVVSPVAAVPAFSDFETYENAGLECELESDRLVLAQPFARTPTRSPFDGSLVAVPNRNHSCLVPIYQQAGEDARAIVAEMPDVWVEARLASLRAWFTDFELGGDPSGSVRNLWGEMSVDVAQVDTDDWSNRFYGELVNRPILLPAVVAALALFGFACRSLRRWVSGDVLVSSDRLVLFAAFVYWSTLVIGVTFELGEQARFRAGVDPLAFAAVAVAAVCWLRQRRSTSSIQ